MRTRRTTLVDAAPLTLDAVDGHRWAESHGHAPVDAATERAWRRERAERTTVEIEVVT